MMGEPDDLWLLTTDDGYGFVVRLEDMMTRLKAGKSVVNVGKGATRAASAARSAATRPTASPRRRRKGSCCCSRSPSSRRSARGKGVQTIKLHRTPIAPEKVVATAVVPKDGTLVVTPASATRT